ncbi:MAG: UbiA family prenyltransferase [Bacteroidota bacterium]|nr:UbiA family prenyltransferase [Bacteroidota bacterium]
MLHRSTIQLLRLPFSYFLMPVFWFALSLVDTINIPRAVLVFVILHVFIYPASNGYNSYMDRDEESIGGIEKPLAPTRQLFFATIILDVMAVALSTFISYLFVSCVVIYIVCSRLYSYRGIRLKQYPFIGYLTVIFNQGSLTFFMVYHGSDANLTNHMSWLGLLAAGFLIGGFYPITQVYQHEADAKDNINTISMLMGKKGTFIFCSVMYIIALAILWSYYRAHELYKPFIVLIIFFIPVIVYFVQWFLKVLQDESLADFKHTMRMNWLASTCTSLAFITIILLQQFG